MVFNNLFFHDQRRSWGVASGAVALNVLSKDFLFRGAMAALFCSNIMIWLACF